jgi:hypothetical protein
MADVALAAAPPPDTEPAPAPGATGPAPAPAPPPPESVLPAPGTYDRAITAGYSKKEIQDWAESKRAGWKAGGASDEDIEKEFTAINAIPEPLRSPVPPPPPAPPGAYYAENEQHALRQAQEQIKDPRELLMTQRIIKQEYANQRLMDGVTAQSRENALKKQVGIYVDAALEIKNKPDLTYQQRLEGIAQITAKLDADPTMSYGDAKLHTAKLIEAAILGEDQIGLGKGYSAAFEGITKGTVTTVQQLMEMANRGELTLKGFKELVQVYNDRDKPDQAALHMRKQIAYEELKNIVYKGADENSQIPEMRPTAVQREKYTTILSALNDEFLAAKGDVKKEAEILSLPHVRELVDSLYPPLERHRDLITHGVPTDVSGIIIPPTVQGDKPRQNYIWILQAPPAVADRRGNVRPMPLADWQEAIETLRRTGQVENFNRHFNTDMGERIIKAVPYEVPYGGYTPPPTRTPAASLGRGPMPVTLLLPQLLKLMIEQGRWAEQERARAAKAAGR